MSGIVGIYYFDGRPVDQKDVELMLASIAHRGPDGSRVWVDGSVGLGHRMLWTTPESLHERLPLVNKTVELAITADARIDNRDDLFASLNFDGRPRETIADSELILAAYEEWGESCPKRLLGDFAFTIWDGRNHKLFCARDPVGIKPFFYYFDGKTFYWGSEPRVIYEDSRISKEPNLTLICLYLLNRFDEREETLYRSIYRLPPSHFMVLENGRLRKGQYWDIDPNYTIRYKTDEEYAEHFLSLFKEVIRARLRSHGPVGALLSGGLDSSSIVCTAQLLNQERSVPDNGLETFSMVFDEFPCDERVYIQEVVRKWNVKANYFAHEKNLAWVDFEQTENFPDVGYFTNLFYFAPVFLNAKQKGINAMLDGTGGDELLATGFDHLTDLMVQGKIFTLMVQLRQDSRFYSYSPYSLFFSHCFKPFIPQPIRTAVRKALRPIRRNGVPPWFNLAFLRKTGTEERLRTMERPRKFPTHSQQRIYHGLFYGWNATVAPDLVDRFSARFGIERRYPFFDRGMMEFLIAVPEDQRWSAQWSKAILRHGMRGILPGPIMVRKDKAEFSCVIDNELKNRQLYKVERLIQTSRLVSLGLIDAARFNKSFNLYKNASVFHSFTNRLVRFIWLELWLRSTEGLFNKGGENGQTGSFERN